MNQRLLRRASPTQRHRDWHYVNLPLDNPDRPATSGLLNKQLPALAGIVSVTGAQHHRTQLRAAGSFTLPATLTSRYTRWKEGVTTKPSSTRSIRARASQRSAYWDALPSPALAARRAACQSKQGTDRQLPKTRAIVASAVAKESWKIAKESAYPPNIENVPTISETFYENSREIANQRVTEAGYLRRAYCRYFNAEFRKTIEL